jgi:hypothetical protein
MPRDGNLEATGFAVTPIENAEIRSVRDLISSRRELEPTASERQPARTRAGQDRTLARPEQVAVRHGGKRLQLAIEASQPRREDGEGAVARPHT